MKEMKEEVRTNKLLPHMFSQYSIPSCQKTTKTTVETLSQTAKNAVTGVDAGGHEGMTVSREHKARVVGTNTFSALRNFQKLDDAVAGVPEPSSSKHVLG